MSIEADLERLALQERRLQFAHFDAQAAWAIGCRLKALAEQRGGAVAIDIRLHGQPLFFCALPGTAPTNVDWIRRKRKTVAMFNRSSYAMGLSLKRENATLESKTGVNLRDYATHGGCFPILLQGGVCIGTITVSGLPQRADHELVVQAIAEFLSVPMNEVALEPVTA
jgi:uncharacterized protein (UPF0303 family)